MGRWKRVAWIVFGITLLGCGTAPVNSYYTLENVMPKEEALPKVPVCKAVLAVESVFVVPPYDMTKVVFRPDELEVRYYTHRHWVSSPEEMVRKLIVRRLDAENLFTTVDNIMFLTEPDLALYAKVLNLEEIDRDKEWNGRLAMSFTLKDDVSGKTVWEYRFDETKPVPKKDIKVVVYTINEIYNRQIKKMVEGMKLFLAGYSRCNRSTPSRREDDHDEPPSPFVDDAPEQDTAANEPPPQS